MCLVGKASLAGGGGSIEVSLSQTQGTVKANDGRELLRGQSSSLEDFALGGTGMDAMQARCVGNRQTSTGDMQRSDKIECDEIDSLCTEPVPYEAVEAEGQIVDTEIRLEK